MKRRITSGGGWPAIRYTFTKAREAGGLWKLWKAMRSKNACKTCALGMGGQRGGMVNERGGFPEVCKKSFQAMVADLQGAIKPEFWQTYSIAQLRTLSPKELESLGRISQPVRLREGENWFQPISWEEAIDSVANRLKELPADRTFWYFSGRSSNEAGFLLQVFARLYGTNNVNNCSYYCHQASGVGLNSSLGTGTATVTLEDLEKTDLVMLIGGNPASNHPRMMTSLMHLRNRKGEVIVINPVIETGLVEFRVPSSPWSLLFGTKIASYYVQPDIGGDLALLTGVAKRIVKLGAHDESFLRAHCEGADAYLASLQAASWDEIMRLSGVRYDEIDEIAELYAEAKSAIFCWTMGITHHANGVENVQAIANLALLRGMVGKPHSGLLPIRGHSNIQGIGSMGVTPQLKQAIFDNLEQRFGVTLPTTPGRDTLACMEGAEDGSLNVAVCLGGNLYGSNPDQSYARQALSKLDQIVYLSTTMNTGHVWGTAKETIILPVLARDEEPEPTTQESMFNYVRVSEGGPSRISGPLSEIEVISRLADAVLAGKTPIDWKAMGSAATIQKAIAKVVPGYESLETLRETKKEFQIPGRTFHKTEFPTPTGKANLFVHSLRSDDLPPGHLRLMTVRSEGQFNTVVYEDYDLYRNQDRRDIILMHPDDCARLGLNENDRVTVRSAIGEMRRILVRPYEQIKAGAALMYYPEANVLVPRTVDPKSKTPAFKNVAIEVLPEAPSPAPAKAAATLVELATGSPGA